MMRKVCGVFTVLALVFVATSSMSESGETCSDPDQCDVVSLLSVGQSVHHKRSQPPPVAPKPKPMNRGLEEKVEHMERELAEVKADLLKKDPNDEDIFEDEQDEDADIDSAELQPFHFGRYSPPAHASASAKHAVASGSQAGSAAVSGVKSYAHGVLGGFQAAKGNFHMARGAWKSSRGDKEGAERSIQKAGNSYGSALNHGGKSFGYGVKGMAHATASGLHAGASGVHAGAAVMTPPSRHQDSHKAGYTPQRGELGYTGPISGHRP